MLAISLCTAQADDAESIKEKLFQAKKTYDSETQKYKKSVEEWLDKREGVARAAGDKKAVDQIKTEREAFLKDGGVSQALPAAMKQQLATARTNLDKSYSTAVKEYLILKDDAAAGAIEKDQKEFRNGSVGLRPIDVSTKEDLQKYLINTVWAWGNMTFKADGSAEVSEWAGFVVAWDAVDRRTVVIRVQKGRDRDKVAVVTFNEEITEAHGFAFGGEKLAYKRKR